MRVLMREIQRAYLKEFENFVITRREGVWVWCHCHYGLAKRVENSLSSSSLWAFNSIGFFLSKQQQRHVHNSIKAKAHNSYHFFFCFLNKPLWLTKQPSFTSSSTTTLGVVVIIITTWSSTALGFWILLLCIWLNELELRSYTSKFISYWTFLHLNNR